MANSKDCIAPAGPREWKVMCQKLFPNSNTSLLLWSYNIWFLIRSLAAQMKMYIFHNPFELHVLIWQNSSQWNVRSNIVCGLCWQRKRYVRFLLFFLLDDWNEDVRVSCSDLAGKSCNAPGNTKQRWKELDPWTWWSSCHLWGTVYPQTVTWERNKFLPSRYNVNFFGVTVVEPMS